MSNITSYPMQDDFETTLAQSWNGATGTVNLNSSPEFTFPVGTTTGIIVNPGQSNEQFARIDSYDSAADTVHVSSITTKKGAGLSYTQQSHASGSVVRISNNYQFWEDIVTSVNSKLGNDGSNPTSTYDLDLVASNWRHRNDGGAMKFTDDFQSEVSLATLANGAGVNDKVKISVTDTTTGYLGVKINARNGLSQSTGSPAGNETLILDIDLTDTTDFVQTSSGAGDSGKVPRLNASGQLATGFLPTIPTGHYNTVTFSISTATASGTQVVNHSLGVTPQLIMFQAYKGNTQMSAGSYDGTSNKCVVLYTGSDQAAADTVAIEITDGANTYKGSVTAWSSTTFTITWVKGSSPTGTLYVIATLQAVS